MKWMPCFGLFIKYWILQKAVCQLGTLVYACDAGEECIFKWGLVHKKRYFQLAKLIRLSGRRRISARKKVHSALGAFRAKRKRWRKKEKKKVHSALGAFRAKRKEGA